MHFYMLTIIEETQLEDKLELKLWANAKGNIWLQIGYDDEDPCTTQGMSLTPEDALALMNELHRLLEEIEPLENPEPKSQPGKQLKLTPESLTQKVNWGGK